jgi:hypothetical protein
MFNHSSHRRLRHLCARACARACAHAALALAASGSALAAQAACSDVQRLTHAQRDYDVQVCHEPPVANDTPMAQVSVRDVAKGRTALLEFRLDAGLTVEQVAVDAQAFSVSDRHPVFGVRTLVRREDELNLTRSSALHLIMLEGRQLRRVLAIVTDSARTARYCDGEAGCVEARRSSSVVAVSPKGHNSVLDLVVGTRVKVVDAEGASRNTREHIKRLSWNGRRYV